MKNDSLIFSLEGAFRRAVTDKKEKIFEFNKKSESVRLKLNAFLSQRGDLVFVLVHLGLVGLHLRDHRAHLAALLRQVVLVEHHLLGDLRPRLARENRLQRRVRFFLRFSNFLLTFGEL